MAVQLDQFTEWKQITADCLHNLELQLEEMGFQTALQKVASARHGIDDERFQVVVVGEFSRGKSTFLNALMGRKILPSLSRPTTAIRNVLVYNEEPYIRLHYQCKDKPARNITEKEFKRLTAPKEPYKGDIASEKEYEHAIHELKEINYAEIGYPLALCKEGVTLVDTPGLGDLDANRGAITHKLIPQADVAILVLTAIKALSLSEMSLLKDRLFQNDINKIFLVVNFKDALSENERKRVYEKVVADLNGLIPESNIHFVSAKEQLNLRRSQNGEQLEKLGKPIDLWTEEETGFALLERDLAQFLQYERGRVKLLTPIRRTHRVLNEILCVDLPMQKNALSRSRVQLEEQVKDFRAKLRNINLLGKNAQKKFFETVLSFESNAHAWYEAELNAIMQAGLQAFADAETNDLAELPLIVESTIAKLERELAIKTKERKELIMKTAMERAGKILDEEWVHLEEAFHDTFVKQALADNGLDLQDSSLNVTVSTRIARFEEIIGELQLEEQRLNNWYSLGVPLGMVIHAVTLIGQSISGLFGGTPSKKDKLRSQIHTELRTSNQEKAAVFQREWMTIVELFSEKYGQLITEQIVTKERQLKTILVNTSEQEENLHKKLELLQTNERNLLHKKQELEDLSYRLAGKEEVVI